MMSPKSTEEWEIEDIITELKAGIPQPGGTIQGVCAYHGSTNKALIFLLRRTADGTRSLSVTSDWKTTLVEAVKATPWLGVVVLLIYGLHIWAKAKGVI